MGPEFVRITREEAQDYFGQASAFLAATRMICG